CIDGECALESDDCYEDQCYEIVGDCDGEKKCEHDDSKCVDTVKKTNICIWLKTPEANIVTIPPITTSDVTLLPVTTSDVTIPPITTSDVTLLPVTTSDVTIPPVTTSDVTIPPVTIPDVTLLPVTTPDVTTPTITTRDVTVLPVTTSGTTIPSPENDCQDKAASDKPSDCPLYSHLCNNSIYGDLMKDQCRKTCGFCDSKVSTTTAPICEDKKGADGKSNCQDVKYLCHVPLYISLISIQCPHTCGLC
ncbi:hypothetical protein LOAG_13882, partial [Loa loa]